jgi:hypothetical protein
LLSGQPINLNHLQRLNEALFDFQFAICDCRFAVRAGLAIFDFRFSQTACLWQSAIGNWQSAI